MNDKKPYEAICLNAGKWSYRFNRWAKSWRYCPICGHPLVEPTDNVQEDTK